MNAILEQINSVGLRFVEFALPMLVQSGVLILILLLTDFALRKKVRAVFRYGIWLLVLIKLVLPTSLSAPLSLGYFLGGGLAYVDISRTATEAETMEPTQAIVSPLIDPPRIEAGRDTSAVAPTTPGAEPAIAEPVSSPAVSITPITWQGVVFLAWLSVVMAMGLLLLQRAIFVRGLVAQAKEANNFMTDTLESCRRSMGVKRKLVLKISANTTSPAVCGLFRPVILVPQNLTSSLSSSQLRAVLLHELAHIRRGDLWVNLAQTVLQIIYFYNPLLWVFNKKDEEIFDFALEPEKASDSSEFKKTLPNDITAELPMAKAQKSETAETSVNIGGGYR
ncbi:MAG: M56 family metallopeptidase [Planctomycetota bacterium]